MADALHTQRKTTEPILERGGDYLSVVKGNQPSLLTQSNTPDWQSLEGTTQTRLNRERIETRRGEVAEGLAGLKFPYVLGSPRLLGSGKGKCGEKRQGPEKRLEPTGTPSCESCKYRFGADSRLAQAHSPAAPARLTERTNDFATSLGSSSGMREAHGRALSRRETK